MNVLLANDFHIAKDSIDEFVKNWDEMLHICKDTEIRKVFIGGDLFDSPTVQTRQVMITVKDIFEKAKSAGIQILAAPGNHDIDNRAITDSWLDVFANQIIVFKEPYAYRELDDIVLGIFPYYLEDTVFPQKLKEFEHELEEKRIDRQNVVLYLHAGIHGALGDFDVPNELPQELLAPYKKVLCAHYHNRTHIKGTNIWNIGSSRAHSFGEDEEKGYTILHPDGSTDFIKNQVNTRYVTEGLTLETAKTWKNRYDERYKVRLVIHCKDNEVDTIDKQELLSRGANKICFDTEKIQAIKAEQSGMEEKFDAKDLQQEYKTFCDEKDLDDKLGLQYLNKI